MLTQKSRNMVRLVSTSLSILNHDPLAGGELQRHLVGLGRYSDEEFRCRA